MVEKKGVQSIACSQVIDRYWSDRSKGELERIAREEMLKDLGKTLLENLEVGEPYTVVMFRKTEDLSPQSLEDVATKPFSKGNERITIEVSFCKRYE
jgi:hypothetical protein